MEINQEFYKSYRKLGSKRKMSTQKDLQQTLQYGFEKEEVEKEGIYEKEETQNA